MSRFTAVLLSYWFCCSVPAFCWWETGHQVIARLAAAQLTPAARIRLARILDVPADPDSIANALARASTWADETRTQTGTGAWHYIDLALQDTEADIPKRCPQDNCAPARIHLFAAQLASPASEPHAGAAHGETRLSDLDALRYLVHLVGDIHQPLHAISDADLGGNCEKLQPPIGKAKNLHAFWDGEIIEQMDVSEQSLAADLEHEVAGLNAQQQHEMTVGSQNDWAWESHEIAVKDIYGKLHIPVEGAVFPATCSEAPGEITDFHPQIDGLYIDSMKPVVRLQLERAGLRLARLLNESL